MMTQVGTGVPPVLNFHHFQEHRLPTQNNTNSKVICKREVQCLPGHDGPPLLHLLHVSIFSIIWSLVCLPGDGLSSCWVHQLQGSHSLRSPSLKLQACVATLGSSMCVLSIQPQILKPSWHAHLYTLSHLSSPKFYLYTPQTSRHHVQYEHSTYFVEFPWI